MEYANYSHFASLSWQAGNHVTRLSLNFYRPYVLSDAEPTERMTLNWPIKRNLPTNSDRRCARCLNVLPSQLCLASLWGRLNRVPAVNSSFSIGSTGIPALINRDKVENVISSTNRLVVYQQSDFQQSAAGEPMCSLLHTSEIDYDLLTTLLLLIHHWFSGDSWNVFGDMSP